MGNKRYPVYNGRRPCDGITYRLSIYDIPPLPMTKELVAEGVGGSDEKIRTFFQDGYWHIECPHFAVNPEYIKFTGII